MVLLLGVVAPAGPAEAHTGGTLTGFENPESAPWDSATGSFYVSNMGPGPIDPMGRAPDGYLSKVSSAGKLVSAKWVTGLRSPKGVHRWGDDLLVADVGQLVVVDVAGARIRRTIDLDALGAQFPNDVTVDDRTGDAYVSDTARVWRVPPDGKASELAKIANAADLGLRRADRLAAVPTLSDNTVQFLTIP